MKSKLQPTPFATRERSRCSHALVDAWTPETPSVRTQGATRSPLLWPATSCSRTGILRPQESNSQCEWCDSRSEAEVGAQILDLSPKYIHTKVRASTCLEARTSPDCLANRGALSSVKAALRTSRSAHTRHGKANEQPGDTQGFSLLEAPIRGFSLGARRVHRAPDLQSSESTRVSVSRFSPLTRVGIGPRLNLLFVCLRSAISTNWRFKPIFS